MLVLCKEREGYYEVIFQIWIRFNRFYSSYDFWNVRWLRFNEKLNKKMLNKKIFVSGVCDSNNYLQYR